MYNRRSNSTDSLSSCCDDACRSALWEQKESRVHPVMFSVCVCVCLSVCVCVCGCSGDTFLMLWWLLKSCSMLLIWSHPSSHVTFKAVGVPQREAKIFPLLDPLILLSTGLVVSSGFSFGSRGIRPPFAPQIDMQSGYTAHLNWV